MSKEKKGTASGMFNPCLENKLYVDADRAGRTGPRLFDVGR